MNLYVLHHAHDLEAEIDVKLIGIYSSEQKAEEAKLRALVLPGFSEYPDGFHIDRYELDQDNWAEGYVTVKW